MDKKAVAKEIFDNMEMTKEQYLEFIQLADELDLDIPEPEETWEDILEG